MAMNKLIINALMNKLSKQCPEKAQVLKQCIDNGESPKTILYQMIEANLITKEQFINFEKQAMLFGISKNDLKDLESCFDTIQNGNNSSNSNYTSFRF